jgi:hypothetical protein
VLVTLRRGREDFLKIPSAMIFTKTKEEEKIHLSHGAWQTFLNRIGNIARKAKLTAGIGIYRRLQFGHATAFIADSSLKSLIL